MAKKTVKVKQIKSSIGRSEKQRKILYGLGLTKLHKVKELQDTDSVRGMINKVHHLVEVVE